MKTKRRSPTGIIIRNLTRGKIPRISLVKRIVNGILDAEGRPGYGVSIVFTTQSGIKRLNRRYRGKDRATDVLAFSALEGRPVKGDDGFLGDVVISLDAAKRQASLFGSTRDRELRLYIVHGVLHLLGYGDETRRELRRMRQKEEKYFKMAGAGIK